MPWQYNTNVEVCRVEHGQETCFWIPISFFGEGGRIYDRDTIRQIAFEGGLNWASIAEESDPKRGASYYPTGEVEIVGVVWVPG